MTATARPAKPVPEVVLARMWWAVMLRAGAVILFAVLAFFWLGRSLPALTALFALYAIADGILAVIAAVRGGGLAARAGLALAGAVGVFAGAAAGILPEVTSPTLAIIIGAWALTRGALEFASALTLRKHMERDWSLALAGMLSMMFGAMFLLHPGFDPWTLVRLLSAYCLILGALLALLAVRFLKGLRP